MTTLTTTQSTLEKTRWAWMTLLLFMITRVGIALIAYTAIILLPANSEPAPYHLRGTEHVLLDVFGSRWDTGFYVSIAEEGYVNVADPFPSTPFFPLLPLLMRGVMVVTGDAVVAGLLITHVALLAAAMLFYRLVALQWGQAVAERAVWYLLIFPTSLFGSAIYTESLFLLSAIGALYAARRGHWWLAGLCGIATALTRLVGVIVAPLLVLEWVMQWKKGKDSAEISTFLATGLPPLGTLAYAAYLWSKFGDPLAFVKGSAAWGRVAQSPAIAIAQLFATPDEGWWNAIRAGHIHINNWIDFSFVLFFLLISFFLCYERRWSEGIFVWLGVMIPFASGLLMSQRRYMWVLFPVFIVLARWGKRPWVDRLITILFLLGLSIFTALFSQMYWVA